MKKVIAILLMVLALAEGANAQTSLPGTLIYPAQPEYVLSSSQKGVKLSTDIVAVALPAAALIGTVCARDWKGLLQGVETAAVTAAFTLALKYGVKEKRPDGSNWHSFPSGHTAVSFASATYLTRRYGLKFGIPAYVLSCYVAWGRCFSKQHFVWDTVVGAAIGAGSALIFTTPWAKKHHLEIAPVSNGESVGAYASFTF